MDKNDKWILFKIISLVERIAFAAGHRALANEALEIIAELRDDKTEEES